MTIIVVITGRNTCHLATGLEWQMWLCVEQLD